MLLVIDIGNTNVVVGCFNGTELATELRLKTDPGRTVDEYAAILVASLEAKLGKRPVFDACVVSSVVPPVTSEILRLVRERFKLEPLLVGPGIKTGIGIKTAEPHAVGADRVVNCAAAKVLHGAPALIIDFGTATTIDYLSAEGNYEGGIIAPGPVIAAESLFERTAKLPRVELSWPASVIGKTTVSQMQAGVVRGYACLIDGLLDAMVAEIGTAVTVIATGGLGRLYAEHSTRIKHYDPHLTLQGMRIIHELNRTAK